MPTTADQVNHLIIENGKIKVSSSKYQKQSLDAAARPSRTADHLSDNDEQMLRELRNDPDFKQPHNPKDTLTHTVHDDGSVHVHPREGRPGFVSEFSPEILDKFLKAGIDPHSNFSTGRPHMEAPPLAAKESALKDAISKIGCNLRDCGVQSASDPGTDHTKIVDQRASTRDQQGQGQGR